MGPQLKAFDGDASPFDACRDELRGCLLGQAAPGVSHRRSSRLWLWLIPIAVLLAVSAFLYLDLSDRRRLDRLASRLNAEPGIVVYSARRADGRYAIGGIRDPLAREPGAVLAETGVSPSEVDFEWRDFYSADERFVRLRELSDRATQLERIRVYFETGESDIEPSQAGLVEQAGSIVRDLLASAAAVDASDLKVVIVGGADGRGDNEANAQLAIERAREAMRMLVARGVPAGQLAVERLGESSPRGLPSEELEWAIDRCVTFRVEGLPAVD
jgi:outer membrane protein OmpA-like peptidoglycan-associated protein